MAGKLKISNIKKNARGRVIHADIEFIPERRLKGFEKVLSMAQEAIDNETIKYLAAYVPLKTGTLAESFSLASRPGTGIIEDGVPYGHYQNFLNGPPYKTIPADDPRYAGDTKRGGHFIERVFEEHGQDIIDAAQAEIDKGG